MSSTGSLRRSLRLAGVAPKTSASESLESDRLGDPRVSSMKSDEKGKRKRGDPDEEPVSGDEGGGRVSSNDKGKGKVVMEEVDSDSTGNEDGSESEEEKVLDTVSNYRRERFKEVAKSSAHRFAHFRDEEERIGEDKDREQNNRRESRKRMVEDVAWAPRTGNGGARRVLPPSLEDLSMKVFVKNADNKTSFAGIPDDLRVKVSQRLCDSRKMNAHFFSLLVQGSPERICVSDCSSLTEDEFMKFFKSFDLGCLNELKLDQSGRCFTDYALLATLPEFKEGLSNLITLSLRGACRLSNTGLDALLCSATALSSLNLSQCSLITYSSIETVAKYCGSVLKQLYLEDCQGIDAKLMLPALQKFELLESLSVSGIESVCDSFICEFVATRGYNMKELFLAGCAELTENSLKDIAKKCPELCSIDLSHCKFTDSSLGLLADGCRSIKKLNLCRNPFSDESIAAFLDKSGESLEELSLNNIRKVGCKTVSSIAKRLKKLQKLDLSWCRDVTDNALGLIVDSCLSLRVLKLFGCTQITTVFLEGHSNPGLQIFGKGSSLLLEHL